jgi:hypothetical protein
MQLLKIKTTAHGCVGMAHTYVYVVALCPPPPSPPLCIASILHLPCCASCGGGAWWCMMYLGVLKACKSTKGMISNFPLCVCVCVCVCVCFFF